MRTFKPRSIRIRIGEKKPGSIRILNTACNLSQHSQPLCDLSCPLVILANLIWPQLNSYDLNQPPVTSYYFSSSYYSSSLHFYFSFSYLNTLKNQNTVQ